MKSIAFTTVTRTFSILFVLNLLICSQSLMAQPVQTDEANLASYELNTSKGKVIINLPSQISNGDVISGKVISEPSGNNIKKQNKNSKILNGTILEVVKNETPVSNGTLNLILPNDFSSNSLPVKLNDEHGNLLSEIELPVLKEAPFHFPSNGIENLSPIFPEYMESGSPASVPGPFDGDFSNTSIKISGSDVEILAESPRAIYFQCPEGISGVEELEIKEKDRLFKGQIRVIDLQLSATETRLKTGQQTTIQLVVSGLKELQSELTVIADNLKPTVLFLEGGNHQEYIISPNDVDESGTWVETMTGQSLRSGDFSVQVNVESPEPNLIIPIFPAGELSQSETIEFVWNPVYFPDNTDFNLFISIQSTDLTLTATALIKEFKAVQSPFTLPDELPPINQEEVYVWHVETVGPGGTITSPSLSWVFGPVPPEEIPIGPGDPCEDPKYVEKEELECADIVRYVYETPLNSVNEDFNTFKYDWQDYFRMLSQTMLQFDLQLSMIKYWIDAGEEIDKQAQDVQKLAGLIKDGIGKGVKAFKEGSEEVMKEMAQEFAEDKVKEFEQHAVGQVSETLGALYDLEDLAIRRIGLGIAKGLTGVYPDKMADHYRRQLQITTTNLSAWVSHRVNYNSGAQHPTLQDGIDEMCDLLNQLDQIEKDFEKAVEEAGFICIECEIPEHLREMMAQLRMDIETHIRMFGDTIDQIRQRLVEARAITNNKNAYEDIARFGSFQANSAKQTREINRVLEESKTEFTAALNTRK